MSALQGIELEFNEGIAPTLGVTSRESLVAKARAGHSPAQLESFRTKSFSTRWPALRFAEMKGKVFQ